MPDKIELIFAFSIFAQLPIYLLLFPLIYLPRQTIVNKHANIIIANLNNTIIMKLGG